MYLLEELNARLRPTILAMRPGTRVLSNSFSMGDWEPDQVIRTGTNTGYFWSVPANVAGQCSLLGLAPNGPAVLRLSQRIRRLQPGLERGADETLGQRLPREAAREKARELFSRFPKAAYMTEVESWRVVDDDIIEFTMRRLPTAD
jgi:hypothetical protein